MPFAKLLIANRGEIACRIIRTARAMGYRTVAVFSDADESAPHIRLADQAIRIGESPPSASYLRIDSIIEAARKTGADAIHPGYGFLSENAEFARACVDNNITFIGPPAEAIRIMGDKSRAKARMVEAGVPIVPGANIATAAAAEQTGYPIMVKAVAGGGGRGMRIVREAADLPEALAAAAREAQSAFGDGALMLEKLIEHGRHIEFQIFADSQGNIIHLGERDCTAQRRRQKILEESPSPSLTPALRARMGDAAVAAARAVNYQNAGTIEFILDATGEFYFLEMNTRLQVEHPVTECVTGLDLVEWQLRVANGEPLPRTQAQISFTGHAIEARLCAEDPYADFSPQTGPIKYFRPQHANIRIDSGIEEGGEVTPFYDSMVAKFIAHGATRADAIRRLIAALEAAPLLSLPTNALFLKDLLSTPEFKESRMNTGMIDTWSGAAILQRRAPAPGAIALAAAILAAPQSGFRNRGPAAFSLTLQTPAGLATLAIMAAGNVITVTQAETRTVIKLLAIDNENIAFERDGIRACAIALRDGATLHLVADGAVESFSEPSPYAAAEPAADPTQLFAPVSGTLLSILPPGTAVAAGDIVAVIEAMKIETRLCAPIAATIARTHAAAGAQVSAKKLLAEFSLPESE
jgi:geranyl-CoA carboxylase alpha subunit